MHVLGILKSNSSQNRKKTILENPLTLLQKLIHHCLPSSSFFLGIPDVEIVTEKQSFCMQKVCPIISKIHTGLKTDETSDESYNNIIFTIAEVGKGRDLGNFLRQEPLLFLTISPAPAAATEDL